MNKVRVVYYSNGGNTYEMAKAFIEGIESVGSETKLYRVTEKDKLDVEDIFSADVIALGSSACGAETIEERNFIPFIMNNKEKFQNKKVLLFGAWGWGKGQFLEIWKKRLLEMGAIITEPTILSNEYPTDETLNEMKELGKRSINL